MARASPKIVSEWLQFEIDEQALTPETFFEKEKAFNKSAFVANRDKCTSSPSFVWISTNITIVPTSASAFEDIVKTLKTNGNVHRDEALSRQRGQTAAFIKAGLDLEQQLYA